LRERVEVRAGAGEDGRVGVPAGDDEDGGTRRQEVGARAHGGDPGGRGRLGLDARVVAGDERGGARPSAIVSPGAPSTGRPASQLAAITGSVCATTPIRRASGARRPTASPTPTASAPFPTGITTAAGGTADCSTSSSPIAP
jgi:hypothetical protein